MIPSTVDIELVVREVLAQLQAAPEALVAEPQAAGGLGTSVPSEVGSRQSAVGSEPVVADQPFTLAVFARVVTMNDVAGRLDSVRRVVVSHEAIVTPAVRDELLRRGIALESAKTPDGAPRVVRLCLMISGVDFDPATLLAALAREGFQATQGNSDCLIAAGDQLAAEIRQGDALGVLLTRHAAAGLCLANRLPGVRAIGGIEAPAVAAASAAVGANLLVVDPRAGTFFQLKQAITEFARGGVRPCPEVFRKRLA
ncbi:MAG: hypothetical protein WCB27_07040 [Thermoguttaceae bacterium]